MTLASRLNFLTQFKLKLRLGWLCSDQLDLGPCPTIHARFDPSLAIFSTRALTLLFPIFSAFPSSSSSSSLSKLCFRSVKTWLLFSNNLCRFPVFSRSVSSLLTSPLSARPIPHDGPTEIASTTTAIVHLLCITGGRSNPAGSKAPLHR